MLLFSSSANASKYGSPLVSHSSVKNEEGGPVFQVGLSRIRFFIPHISFDFESEREQLISSSNSPKVQ